MKHLKTGLIAALCATVLAAPATAASLQIDFTGVIDRTNAGDNSNVPNIGPLAIGDAVSGSFRLDTSTSETNQTATRSVYIGAVSQYSMTLDGLTFTDAPPATFQVRNDNMSGSSAPLRDSIVLRGSNLSGPATVGGLTPSLIQFALGGTDTSILTGLEIPTIAQMNALFAADTIGGNLNFLSFTDGSEARFNVSSISIAAVPLPASLPLLFAAFGGLATLRRRKSKA